MNLTNQLISICPRPMFDLYSSILQCMYFMYWSLWLDVHTHVIYYKFSLPKISTKSIFFFAGFKRKAHSQAHNPTHQRSQQQPTHNNPKMALVHFPSRSYGLLNLQFNLPPPRLPLSSLQPLLLAPRLCWNLPHDHMFLLCPYLLRLSLPPLHPPLLPLLHFFHRSLSHHHPPSPCPLHSPLPVFPGRTLPHHGVLWRHSGGTRGGPTLGGPARDPGPHVWDCYGDFLWGWGGVLRWEDTRAVETRGVWYSWP